MIPTDQTQRQRYAELVKLQLQGRRFLQKPYRTFLPTHWYDEAPDELSSREPGEAVSLQRFEVVRHV